MKKIKVPQNVLNENHFGGAVLHLQELNKKFQRAITLLEKSYLIDKKTGKYKIDPFIAREGIDFLKKNKFLIDLIDQKELDEVINFIYSNIKIAKSKFEKDLREFCDQRDISLEGRYPKFIINDFLQISVSTDTGTCKIGNRKVKSLLIESISETIDSKIKEELERLFDPNLFIELLNEAYNKVISINNIKKGEPARIKDIYSEMILLSQPSKFLKKPTKANFIDYTQSRFSIEIGKLIKSNNFKTKDGKRLELAPTAFAKEEGLPVVVTGSTRYIGRLFFS